MAKLEKDTQFTELQIVAFKIGLEEYAIDIDSIIEIIAYKHPTPVPKAPDFIEGVVDLRGTVIPIIDLKKSLGMEGAVGQCAGHILVVKIRNTVVGISVGEVVEVVHIEEEKIQMPQHILKRGDARYLKGFCKISDRLVLLLDASALLTDNEKDLLEVL
jgi:purine-binding chemotaxis protein CheW